MSNDDKLLAALQASTARGEVIRFGQDRWQKLSNNGRLPSPLIVRLVTGPTAPTGVQIHDAVIDGDVNLRNARGPGGGAANSLKLQDCQLWGGTPGSSASFDACHSHLSRLSLIDCATTGVHLSSALIDGDLLLDGLHPLDRDEDMPGRWRDECWVRARGLRVDGSVSASGARLKVNESEAPPECWSDSSAPYALDLREARVGGEVRLRCRKKASSDRFVALGGVNVTGATIAGDLDASGASLAAVDREDREHKGTAFRGRILRLGGILRLGADPVHSHRFEVHGAVDLNWAQLGGVVLSGARLDRYKGPPDEVTARELLFHPGWEEREANFVAGESRKTLAYLVPVGGSAPSVMLDGSSTPIHDLNDAEAVDLTTEEHVSAYLEFFCRRVWGDEGPFLIEPASISLARATEGKWIATAQLRYGDSVFKATFEIKSDGQIEMTDDEPLASVQLQDQVFARPYVITDLSKSTNRGTDWTSVPQGAARLPDDFPGVELDASVSLSGARVSGPVMIQPERLADTVVEFEAVDPLRLSYVAAYQIWIAIQGAANVDLTGARVTSDLEVWTADESSELKAREIQVGGDLTLSGAFRAIDLSDASIASTLSLGPLDLGQRPSSMSQPGMERDAEVVLSNAHMGDLKVVRIRSTDRFTDDDDLRNRTIDLTGATASLLDDDGGLAWGLRTQLRLNGFTYQRIADGRSKPSLESDFVKTSTVEASSAKLVERKASTGLNSRLAFVRAQYSRFPPPAAEYSPQPYQHLAHVLRSQGDFHGADVVTFQKLRLERIALSRWRVVGWAKKLLFELPFGYGLMPVRALAVFLAWWAVGAVAVLTIAPLVVNAGNVSTVLTARQGGDGSISIVPVVPVQSTSGEAEVVCRDKDALLYALDVMLPVVDLGHESACRITARDSLDGLVWRGLKALYAIVAWIITTGLIVTASGVVRRQAEQ